MNKINKVMKSPSRYNETKPPDCNVWKELQAMNYTEVSKDNQIDTNQLVDQESTSLQIINDSTMELQNGIYNQRKEE